MPFVRINHPSGNDQSYSDALSQGVHNALVDAFGIPKEDYFQVVTEHKARVELKAPAEFLDIAHSDEVVMVQITCAEGRSIEQKKALYMAITENLNGGGGVPKADVIISLIETNRENWSFGNGIAPFA